jgi:hypothetical protein
LENGERINLIGSEDKGEREDLERETHNTSESKANVGDKDTEESPPQFESVEKTDAVTKKLNQKPQTELEDDDYNDRKSKKILNQIFSLFGRVEYFGVHLILTYQIMNTCGKQKQMLKISSTPYSAMISFLVL